MINLISGTLLACYAYTYLASDDSSVYCCLAEITANGNFQAVATAV